MKSNLDLKEKLNSLKTIWSFKQLVVISVTACLLVAIYFVPIRWVHVQKAIDYTKDTVNIVYADKYHRVQKTNKKMPLILFWTTYYGSEDFYFGLGHETFKDHNCPVSNCETTSNRSLINESDAVMFHMRNANLEDLPDPNFRKSDQHYIFFLFETPIYTYVNLSAMKGYFNWTITYRLDSDFILPRSYFAKINSTDVEATSVGPVTNTDVQTTRVGPRKLILWMVSNCQTSGGREHYVRELRKYVPVDEYGSCSHRSCNKTFASSIYEKYKFYLSFENSLCKDYVTEKFFKILPYRVVPVCYGLGNYSAVAPPNSYIDARNFESPQKLAQYLVALDQNETAYNQYFEWKTMYKLQNETHVFCELCKRLNGHNPTKVYHNIYNWWYNGAENNKEQICLGKLPYNPI